MYRINKTNIHTVIIIVNCKTGIIKCIYHLMIVYTCTFKTIDQKVYM